MTETSGNRPAGELTPDTAVAYLRGRGVLPFEERATARSLGGGVSNDVIRIETPSRAYVVKQALGTLRVADEWRADRERALTEAVALRLAGDLAPGAVPAVFDMDPTAMTLTIEAAPPNWRDWKSILLDESRDVDVDAEIAVAADLGRILGTWHSATSDGRLLATRFDGAETFEQLRVRPYHRTVMERRPDVADAVDHVIHGMKRRRICLVHGDFSPKNVLVGDGRVWVIDFEVAHLGDPHFDLGFLLCHLLLKSVHQPSRAAGHRAAAAAFLAAYRGTTHGAIVVDDTALAEHLGCLLLARVHGKSPAEYLTESERDAVSRLGTELLKHPPARVLSPWDGMTPALAPMRRVGPAREGN